MCKMPWVPLEHTNKKKKTHSLCCFAWFQEAWLSCWVRLFVFVVFSTSLIDSCRLILISMLNVWLSDKIIMPTVTKKVLPPKPTPMVVEEKVMKKEGTDQHLWIAVYTFFSTKCVSVLLWNMWACVYVFSSSYAVTTLSV